MATNYTENYQLPIWAADDAFLRTEFNDAHEKIDGAIAGLIVTGTYTGDADSGTGRTKKQTVTLGFQPRFLFVRDTSYRGSTQVSDDWTPHQLGFAVPGHGHWVYGQYQVLEITETGFVAGGVNCLFNGEDTVYAYLAVR